jgi:manganese/zinc/iron transport system permease protein
LLLVIAGAVGGVSGYVGAAISASSPHVPTGPIIVLVCFAVFAGSLLLAPNRGIVASLIRHRQFQVRVHRRQGLLALAHGEPIFDRLTLSLLRRAGLIRKDGVPTDTGRAQAGKVLRDERRWEMARQIYQDEAVSGRYDGLTPIEAVLTRDEIGEIDRRIGRPAVVREQG